MDRPQFKAAATAFLATAALTGCAGTATTYPSLAPRPIEKMAIEEPSGESSTAPGPTPETTAMDANSMAQVAAAEGAGARFDTELAAANRAVAAAAGQPVGSEVWVAAQQALSRLDQAHGETATALASLDAMMVAAGGAPSAALAAAWARVAAIDEAQRGAFSALVAKLAQP